VFSQCFFHFINSGTSILYFALFLHIILFFTFHLSFARVSAVASPVPAGRRAHFNGRRLPCPRRSPLPPLRSPMHDARVGLPPSASHLPSSSRAPHTRRGPCRPAATHASPVGGQATPSPSRQGRVLPGSARWRLIGGGNPKPSFGLPSLRTRKLAAVGRVGNRWLMCITRVVLWCLAIRAR
jgi:hypothetical protein